MFIHSRYQNIQREYLVTLLTAKLPYSQDKREIRFNTNKDILFLMTIVFEFPELISRLFQKIRMNLINFAFRNHAALNNLTAYLLNNVSKRPFCVG